MYWEVFPPFFGKDYIESELFLSLSQDIYYLQKKNWCYFILYIFVEFSVKPPGDFWRGVLKLQVQYLK